MMRICMHVYNPPGGVNPADLPDRAVELLAPHYIIYYTINNTNNNNIVRIMISMIYIYIYIYIIQ